MHCSVKEKKTNKIIRRQTKWQKEKNKNSKFVAIAFSFIIHTDNYHFVGTEIRVSDPPWKPRKLVPHEI